MLNNIAIGPSVTLDLQTRTLTRTRDGKSVILPASACLCLRAMADAQGEVLSQEQLMDIGWRSEGVEVTENSVRVMINKLRRALTTLGLQEVITLLAVTRSGYRLIVLDRGTPQEPALLTETPPLAEQIEPNETPAPVVQVQAKPTGTRKAWKKPVAAAAGGIIAGFAVAALLYRMYMITPEEVDFIPWNGAGSPAHTQVFVQKGREDQKTIIEATLNNYSHYALGKRPTEDPARVLYVTTGISRTQNHLGLIACQKPLQDSKNDCESFYFRVY